MKPCLILRLNLLTLVLGGLVDVAFAGVIAPPGEEVARLGLDAQYEKYLSVGGFPIVASAKVEDEALLEAGYLIEKMIGHRPDILKALRNNKVRLSIMATDELTTDIPEHATLKPKVYWDKRARGLGASEERPSVSVGEENLLALEGDPYGTESIMIHEFAHAIHLMGVNSIDDSFQGRLEKTFNRASLKGLWKSKYAGTNPAEYWAEGVQSWFDTNRENDFEHNHVNTREELRAHDPALAALVESIFGDAEWRYVNPRGRRDAGHLATLNRKTAPVFAWPPDLVAAYDALQSGEDRKSLELSVGEVPEGRVSGKGDLEVRLRFDNQSMETVRIFWVDFSGERKPYGFVDPGRNHDQSTFSNHLWVLVGESGEDLGWVAAAGEDGRVIVK
ncbi:hypothetical protein VSU19_16670 [Verrucomicrobiales bacterium BCK34]|nr:hypothetical protein [Verrucomicrobiales bacterium BCK34]